MSRHLELWPKELKRFRTSLPAMPFLRHSTCKEPQALSLSLRNLSSSSMLRFSHICPRPVTTMIRKQLVCQPKEVCFVQDELTCYKERLAKSVFKSAEASVQAYLDQISKEQYEVDSVVR